MVKEKKADKKKGVVSRVRSGLRKLSKSSDSTRAIRPRVEKKKSVPTRTSSQESKSEESEYQFFETKPTDETSPLGFFSLLDDNEKTVLKERFQRSRKAQPQQKMVLPSLISEIASLLSIFPTLEKATVPDLLARYEGNCKEVYDFLLSEEFSPAIEHDPAIFTNAPDVHYITEYFHGFSQSKESISDMFVDAEPGTFITIFREDANGFNYLLCFKNILDGVTEKPIRGPVVPEGLKAMLDLGSGIHAPANCVRALPCLYSTLEI